VLEQFIDETAVYGSEDYALCPQLSLPITKKHMGPGRVIDNGEDTPSTSSVVPS